MAVVGGATITDDALFGIPDPDYSDTEEDGGSSNKKPLAATLSSESIGHNSTSCAGVESTHSNDKSTDKATDEELEVSKPDCADNEDAIKTSSDATTNDVKSGIDNKRDSTSSGENRLSPDAALDGLSLNNEVGSNRGSFRSSGSRSPIGLIMGVSHEHVAADPVLIEPKKVPNVPQLTKEQKELQRELQFKQKQGNMLEKKPELKKVMDDRKHKIKKEELKKEQESKQSTFSIKMGQQAKKLLEMEEQEEKKKLGKLNSSNEPQLDEFKKVHSKIHRNKITT